MGPPQEGAIRRPIAPRANALTTELHLAPPRSVYAGGSPCFDELTETGNSVFGRGDVAEPFRFNREVLRTF